MKKLLAAMIVAGSVIVLPGCAAIVSGGAMLNGASLRDKPVERSELIDRSQADVYNAAVRAFAKPGRKLLSSDRAAGMVQGEVNKVETVSIKIDAAGTNRTMLVASLAFTGDAYFGTPDMRGDLDAVVADIINGGAK